MSETKHHSVCRSDSRSVKLRGDDREVKRQIGSDWVDAMTTRSQRAERRETLLRGAMEVMADQGIAESRLADIAARAGISTGQVLYYFDSKADLFIQALRLVEHDLRHSILTHTAGMPFLEKFEYFLQSAAPEGPGDFHLLLWMEAWELAPRDKQISRQLQQIEDQWLDTLKRIVTEGRDAGELRIEDQELHEFALRFSALMDGLTIQVVIGSPHIDREKMLDICRGVARTALRWKHNEVPPRRLKQPAKGSTL